MSIVYVISARPVPERRPELVAAIDHAAAMFHTEQGCELFTLLENDDRIVIIEKWADQSALRTHFAQPALANLMSSIGPMLAGAPDVQLLTPHALGTAPQGEF